eukprot:3315376-Rhodomonas_salina.4
MYNLETIRKRARAFFCFFSYPSASTSTATSSSGPRKFTYPEPVHSSTKISPCSLKYPLECLGDSRQNLPGSVGDNLGAW